jgi:hypothetical protein
MRSVLGMLQTAGRLLWRHWPALLAWYLAGTLGRFVVIQVAGYIGAYTAVLGSMLLPLAILSRLVALVAMLLVLRDGMRQLQAIAPQPADPRARRRDFLNALLVGILPFFAFYAAWGYLRQDASAYYSRVLAISTSNDLAAIADDAVAAGDGLHGAIELTPVTVAIVVVAFVLRWLLKRYRAALPAWFGVFAAYLEALWVYFAVTVIGIALGAVGSWVSTRQGMVWLGDIREHVHAAFAPLGFLWDGVEWLLGEAGGLILLPVAWLTIAGVVFAQAVAADGVPLDRLGGARGERLRGRYRSLPSWLRTRLGDLWADLVSRFTPIFRAIVLMWRAGPVLIGGFVLLYTVLLAVQGWLGVAVTRVVGPQDLSNFWFINDDLIFLVAPVLIEPVRIALVAAGYDGVIGRLRKRQADARQTDAGAGEEGAAEADQGVTTALTNDGQESAESRSTVKGPDASSGTM